MNDQTTFITTMGRLGSGLFQAVKGALFCDGLGVKVGAGPASIFDVGGSVTITGHGSGYTVTLV